MEAVASAFALATVAQQTAFLIQKVYNAHRDAEQLYQKTQNLSHLLKNVARLLERRNNRHGNRERSEHDQDIHTNIKSTLELCETCIKGIHREFKALVEKNAHRSSAQFRQRLRFVRRQNYIAAQERDITMHLSTLSVLLQSLQHEEREEQRAQTLAEQRGRQQWAQNQQDIHADFLRQLFALLQYVFQHAATGSQPHSRQASASEAVDATEQVGPREPPTIGNEDSQATIESLFGNPIGQQRDQSGLREYVLHSSRDVQTVEEVSTTDPGREDVVDVDTISQDALEVELASLNQYPTRDMTEYSCEKTLVLAIKKGSIHLVHSLIDEGASTSSKDPYGWTLLHHAVFCLNLEMVDLLLTHDRSACTAPEVLNAQTQTGETALIFAVQRANTIEGFEIAQALLEQPNCDVNISDGRGSALYYAVNEGRPSNKPRRSLVQSLAENKADVQAVYEKIPESVSNYGILTQYISKRENQEEITGDEESQGTTDANVRRSSTSKSGKRWTLSRVFSNAKTKPSPEPSE